MGSRASCTATGVGEMWLNTNGAGVLITVRSSAWMQKAKRLSEGAQRGDADGGGRWGRASVPLFLCCAVHDWYTA